MKIVILYIVLLLVNIANSQTIILIEKKSFPTAHGFGKYTTGGRGQDIYQVTNLNNSGSGSFRDAVSQGNRLIIFRVGGTITLNNNAPIYFGGDNITVAGETAPGGGITIHGEMVDTAHNENIIIRFIRFRGGDQQNNRGRDSFRVRNLTDGKICENFIFDHCSFSWGDDENFSLEARADENSSIENVTVQNSIIAQPFRTGHNLILWRKTLNISFVRNYMANALDRAIRASTRLSEFEMINNVIYNHNARTNPSYQNKFDIIGNIYKSAIGGSTSFQTVRLESISEANFPDGDISLTEAYINDNIENGEPITISSNLNPYLLGSPIFNSGTNPLPVLEVEQNVLNNVGSNIFLDSNDEDQINNYYSGSDGRKTNEAAAGGLPTISGGTPYTDSNNDGISDTWASTHDISSASEVKDAYPLMGIINNAGYNALEIFLADLAGDFDRMRNGLEQPDSSWAFENGPDPDPQPGKGRGIPLNILLTLD